MRMTISGSVFFTLSTHRHYSIMPELVPDVVINALNQKKDATQVLAVLRLCESSAAHTLGILCCFLYLQHGAFHSRGYLGQEWSANASFLKWLTTSLPRVCLKIAGYSSICRK